MRRPLFASLLWVIEAKDVEVTQNDPIATAQPLWRLDADTVYLGLVVQPPQELQRPVRPPARPVPGAIEPAARFSPGSGTETEKSAADQRAREAAGRARISGYEYDEAVNVHGLDPEEDPWELWPGAQDLRRCETVSAAVGGALKRMERPRRRWRS